jgi:hypothetical protein
MNNQPSTVVITKLPDDVYLVPSPSSYSDQTSLKSRSYCLSFAYLKLLFLVSNHAWCNVPMLIDNMILSRSGYPAAKIFRTVFRSETSRIVKWLRV